MASGQFRTVFRDYRDSWTSLTGQPARIARRKAALWFYGLPTLLAVALLVWHVEIPTLAPFLTAMSVFTALLFGLLFLVFNLAVTVRKDTPTFANAHGLGTVISDLRATISYTIVVAVALVVLLAMATAFTTSAAPIVSVPPTPSPNSQSPIEVDMGTFEVPLWWWSPPLTWLALHLILNVLKILERFRTAFNFISR